MIFICNNSRTAADIAVKLCQDYKVSCLDINSSNLIANFDVDPLNIFLIPICGEEDLSNLWYDFLVRNSIRFLNSKNLFFLFGVYDLFINKDSFVCKQIEFIFYGTDVDFFIYEKKLSRMNFLHGLEMMKRYMNLYKSDRIFSKELSSISKFKFLIKKVEFVNSCRVAINSRNRLDFTSSYDGFTNTLSRLPRDERFCVLKDILINANVKELVCNRVDLSDFRFVFENIFLERIYFKSCELVTMPSLIGCKNVLLVNLVANNFKEVDFSNFPSSVKRINLSKNKIEKVYSPIVKNKKLESLAMFNNKISDFFWLKFFENLIYLNIGMNPFSKFPEEILMLDSLEHLVLALTDIKDIPLEILNLKKLKVLDLTGCPMIKFYDPVIQSLLSNGVKILC